MYDCEDLEIWNLTPGGEACVDALEVFNVVGRLKRPRECRELWYALNGGERRPVFLGHSPRLSGLGDFNIDGISTDELAPSNELQLWVHEHSRTQHHSLAFRARRREAEDHCFDLRLHGIENVEEIGQCVEGRWRIGRDERGEPCLEIRAEDAGYDRLFALGSRDWTEGYRVRARLLVTKWTRRKYFNVGLLYKWNPHLRGEGRSLPRQWSGGLAYYAAKCPGLRLRVGVDVRYGPFGRRTGSYVLGEKAFSSWRRWAGALRNSVPLGNTPIAQLKRGTPYVFDLSIDRDRYALRVQEEGSRKDPVELSVAGPPTLLPSGCAGLIACDCGVRVYEYTVRPDPSRLPCAASSTA